MLAAPLALFPGIRLPVDGLGDASDRLLPTAALGAVTVLVRGLEFEHDRLAAAASDPVLLATNAAETLVREGVPFRDAYEQVAAQVREAAFEPPPPLPLPRLGDVTAAVAAARTRWSSPA